MRGDSGFDHNLIRREGTTKIKGIPIDENGAIAFEPVPKRDLEAELIAEKALNKDMREALDSIGRLVQANPFTMPLDMPRIVERKIEDLETRLNDLRLSLEQKGKS